MVRSFPADLPSMRPLQGRLRSVGFAARISRLARNHTFTQVESSAFAERKAAMLRQKKYSQSTCEHSFSNRSLNTTTPVMFVGIRAEGPRDFSPGRAGAAGDALGQRRPKRPFRLKDGANVGVQRSRRPSGEKRGRRAAGPRAATAARSGPGLSSRRPSGEKHGRRLTESRAPLAAPTPPEADRRALSGPSAENARFCQGHVPAIRPETSASGRFHPSH